MGAWGIPAINTLLLLSSGVTVTWAHWALKKGDRKNLIFGLAATVPWASSSWASRSTSTCTPTRT